MSCIYLCENSLEGIFSGVYAAYESQKGHKNIRLQIAEETYERELFCEYEEVRTDAKRALRVKESILRKISPEAYELVYYSGLSGKAGRADDIYRFLLLGFTVGRGVVEQVSHPYVLLIIKRSCNVTREAQHYEGFLRFSELSNGLLFAETRPDNNILPVLGEHFSDRFPEENWIIYEAGRKQAALHRQGMPFVLMKLSGKEELLEKLGVHEFSEREKQLQMLWKEFVTTIAIKERKNEDLQKQMLPLKCREFMREYQK